MANSKKKAPTQKRVTARTPRLRFHEVTAARWPDLERLFEARGGPKNCWCMVWRAQSAGERRDARSRKRALKSRVEQRVPIGILGYLGDEPVAWCSVAPRETLRRLTPKEPDPSLRTWSIVCFFVRRELRGQGLTSKLIAAAVATAKRHGARVVESYPVTEDSPSYRFMGRVPTFRENRFREVGRAGTRRHVMRRSLTT